MNEKIEETLEKDAELRFPHIFSVEASAGSGKTYTLTLRILQFLLSRNIPENKLTNILGITFTNNSAKEMKRQVLEKLKLMRLGLLDDDTKNYIADIITFAGANPAESAEKLIYEILSNYHDFQIRTIDSFTSKILKASALELSLPPVFEISTESSDIINYAVENMIESAGETLLSEFLNLLNGNQAGGGIDFNPVKSIKDKMKYLLETESNYNAEFSFDFSFKEKLDENLRPVIEGLKDILKIAGQSGFEIKGNVKKETIDKIKNYLDDKNYFGLVNERKRFPYKMRKSAGDSADYSEKWEELFDGFNEHLPDIAKLKNLPYLTLYKSFKDGLRNAYKALGLVYISDINKKLSIFLSRSSVPEIYFHLGNVIYHYFIDEFQDTSKVQWQNLKPLIEESLSKGGSLFTVGDLKQSLYGFRGADYKIMKSLLDNPERSFPSANEFKNIPLKTNFRSDKVLVDYASNVFKNIIRDKVESVGDPAGFLTYEQDTPKDRNGKNTDSGGYYSTEIFQYAKDLTDGADSKEDIEEEADKTPDNPLDLIEARLIEIIEDLKSRNYNLGDIAVLARKNSYLNDISGRLIANGYSVVAQSSLDIRNRKVIKEIELLLNFLNSPIEDFNFGCFILGDVFRNAVGEDRDFEKFIFEVNLNKTKRPLYILFKESHESLWNRYFEELFNKVGYLPLYEIVLHIYKIFNLSENFACETAYLAHFLDIIQKAEKNGSANLNDIAELMNSEDDISKELFSIELPKVENAITLLTVHKAKGLQWRAVINVFFAEENYALRPSGVNSKSGKARNKNEFAAETKDIKKDNGGNCLELFYITKKMYEDKKNECSKSDYLESIYNESIKDENISDLNNFYVALTRAKHEIYNLIISKDCCSIPPSSGGKAEFITKPEDKNKHEFTLLDCGYCDIGFESAVNSVNQYLVIKRGDFYHKVLSEIKYTEDFENLNVLIEKYTVLLRIKNNHSNILGTKESIKEIKEKILRLKENELLSKLFDKERFDVFTEKEYLSGAGIIYRMDRVAISKEPGGIIYILDYKTGDMNKEELESYKIQLSQYKSVLTDIYKDRKISSVIYAVDTFHTVEC